MRILLFLFLGNGLLNLSYALQLVKRNSIFFKKMNRRKVFNALNTNQIGCFTAASFDFDMEIIELNYSHIQYQSTGNTNVNGIDNLFFNLK